MKIVLFNMVIIFFSLLFIPMCTIKKSDEKAVVHMEEKIQEAAVEVSTEKEGFDDIFRILLKESDEIVEVKADDYITGVVSAEMPALYHKEALKAQAVAAYTYACRKREAAKDGKYDLTDDPDTDQCYIDTEKAKKKWGDKYDEYSKTVRSAVEEVGGEYLEYDGVPALTVYHAISSGTTESCKNVWGTAIPYLVPTESNADKLSPDYLSTVTLSSKELGEKLNELCDTSGDDSKWFSDAKTTKSGRVTSIKVCGTELTGSAVASTLSLRSANFTVKYSDSSFTFEVKGYGHGVGMSQFGADYMAKQGKNYKEILLHYYNGCTLKKPK